MEVQAAVLPLGGENSSEGRHFLILFEMRPTVLEIAGEKRPPVPKRASAERKRVTQLEQELAASREYLQSMIQDLEAANEELQSANEEVLSSNEELQSTNEELDTAKEELQSTNEELNTLNEELQEALEELMRQFLTSSTCSPRCTSPSSWSPPTSASAGLPRWPKRC